MTELIEITEREAIFLWYYTNILFEQIAPFWIFGILIGSLISVFAKNKIHALFLFLNRGRASIFALIPASILGILSPLCMYGTIPIAASFSQKGLRHDVLASFMVSSVLLNPQLLMYTLVLGQTAFFVRLIGCFICGIVAGLVVRALNKEQFFNFEGFTERASKDTHPNPFLRYLKNVGRNFKATWLYFFIGILLTALYQRYVPQSLVANLFGSDNRGFGVLSAAALGIPLYACGGGTIPLLWDWLLNGMTMGAAASFMLTGAATKFTNLGALKIVLPAKQYIGYILFIGAFSFVYGSVINVLV